MVREPTNCGPDAWKRWLREGFTLFDRAWSGWMVVWWLFSLVVVAAVASFGNLFGILLLSGLSAAAFGTHVAIFDVLARGKRGPGAWISAIGSDWRVNGRSYLKTGLLRIVVVSVVLGCITLFSVGLLSLMPEITDAAPAKERPFWDHWTVWAWIWLIPAGWQRGGVLGWGHWLVRREGIDMRLAEKLARLAVAKNMKSFLIITAALMGPVLLLMLVFPPIIPLWDLYAAAVCWRIWDEIFGSNGGLSEMEKSRALARTDQMSGA